MSLLSWLAKGDSKYFKISSVSFAKQRLLPRTALPCKTVTLQHSEERLEVRPTAFFLAMQQSHASPEERTRGNEDSLSAHTAPDWNTEEAQRKIFTSNCKMIRIKTDSDSDGFVLLLLLFYLHSEAKLMKPLIFNAIDLVLCKRLLPMTCLAEQGGNKGRCTFKSIYYIRCWNWR